MPLLSQVLTKGSGVVVAWTHESQLAQEWHELLRRALVDALPLGECVQVVEHLEKSSARLVDRADDGAASARQRLEQRDTLEARRAVQTTVTDRTCYQKLSFLLLHNQEVGLKMLEVAATYYIIAV